MRAVGGFTLALALFLALNFCGTSARTLPKYITRCKKHDAQMTQCLKNAVEQIHPLLKDGIPEMHIPPIEPFKVQTVTFDTGRTFKATFENISVHGLSSFKLKDVKFDYDQKTLELDLEFFDVWADSNYKIKGKLIVLDLDGTGLANGSVSYVSADAKLTGKTRNVKGKEYIYFDTIKLDLTFKGGYLYLHDIFKNNPELSEQTNRIIAEHIDSTINELKPVMQSSFEQLILGLLEKVMARYSLDELFAND